MTTVVEITSLYHKWLMYIGLIGAIICFLTSLTLLCHVAYHYRKIFHKQHSDQSKYGYILLFIFYFASIITSLSKLLIDTNILTETPSAIQCTIGYLLFYVSGSITIAILYLMLLYRINIIFQGTIFEYSSYIFYIFYIIILFDILLCIGDRIFRVIEFTKFELLYESNINILSCYGNTIGYTINVRYTLIFTSSIHIFLAFAFLYMFIKRLRLLNHGMIKQFISEHCSQKSDSKSITTSTATTSTSTKSKSLTVDTVVEEYRSSIKLKQKVMSDSVFRIIELNDLMKKQTILVIIAIFSTLIFWLLIGINTYHTQQFGWDFIINSLCVWLMSGVAKKYWIFCKKYGFCRCCYKNITQLILIEMENEIDGINKFERHNTNKMVNDSIEIVIKHKENMIKHIENNNNMYTVKSLSHIVEEEKSNNNLDINSIDINNYNKDKSNNINISIDGSHLSLDILQPTSTDYDNNNNNNNNNISSQRNTINTITLGISDIHPIPTESFVSRQSKMIDININDQHKMEEEEEEEQSKKDDDGDFITLQNILNDVIDYDEWKGDDDDDDDDDDQHKFNIDQIVIIHDKEQEEDDNDNESEEEVP